MFVFVSFATERTDTGRERRKKRVEEIKSMVEMESQVTPGTIRSLTLGVCDSDLPF